MVLAFFCIHRKTGKTREREAEGLPRPSELNSRCRSESGGMGDDSPGFCRREVTERGRMEFSRDESRAITESGSGHENKIY